jgi:LysR family glycine cleavage system transcriptional activator
MGRRLPNLNSLRAFEAAARRLGFSLAADELCVTQGAIGRQIKSLETELGIQSSAALRATFN